MARKRPAEEDVRETNRRMTPSERQAEDVPSPDRETAETLHMPRPGTGAWLKGRKRAPQGKRHGPRRRGKAQGRGEEVGTRRRRGPPPSLF